MSSYIRSFCSGSFVTIALSMYLAACGGGGGGGSTPPPAVTYTLGGTVSGLSGTLVLQNNAGDDLTVNTNGAFTFATPVAQNGVYAVTVLTQPVGQICTVGSGSGTANANISNISATCSNITYTIGGTVSGLNGTLVLQNNAGGNLTVNTNGAFTFATPVAQNGVYAVTVLNQPVGQTCTVGSGSGTANANVTNLSVVCSNITYTLGGTVSGLSGTLVLQNNAGDNLTVNTNGAFTFAMPVAQNGAYAVTVLTQPTQQTCGVSSGNGTATGNVTLVAVNCTSHYWTWQKGSNLTGQVATYGVQSVAAAANIPGARDMATSWKDNAGNLWMFGGTITGGVQNELWKFDGNNWAWMSGNTVNQAGVYGTQGVAAGTNKPGARAAATGASSGVNAWLFGGEGWNSAQGQYGKHNDLWKFDGANWTWVSGSNAFNQSGIYGTKGVAAAANVPGARTGAMFWADGAGNLWLFGGMGLDSAGTLGRLNDLWKFDGTNWTWMGGGNVVGQAGVYGTKGVAAATNIPGARESGVIWVDASNNVWMFGGFGAGYFNDLWKFDGMNWTWISGSNLANQAGVYGAQGVAAATNVPSARSRAVGWEDGFGNLWMFGGSGNGTALNDLWKFNGSNWTWVAGSNLSGQSGVYGTLGVAAVGNTPGYRYNAISWKDGAGNLMLFGGWGKDSAVTSGSLNDQWSFQP